MVDPLTAGLWASELQMVDLDVAAKPKGKQHGSRLNNKKRKSWSLALLSLLTDFR